MKKVLAISVIGMLTLLNGAEISGQGFLKTKGGDVKTCAGSSVYLNLATGDNNDYILAKRGYEASFDIQRLTAKILNTSNIEDSEEVKLNRKKLADIPKTKYYETQCDAQGNFKFKNIKNGLYNIGTTVQWYVGGDKQGGFIHKKINVVDSSPSVFITE